jgi:hypothetical protein
MKQETNNEIDLLLRRLGRRTDAELQSDENHLDADELSSYAENALPSAARARYTEHIADCSRCRELVVQLSSSVGLINAEEAVRVGEPSGLKKFLASLFSPMVLRYAAPALGVLVVMIIGFVVMRRDRMAESVVQVRAPEQKTGALPKTEETSAGFVGELADKTQGSPTPAAEGRIANKQSPQDQPAPPPNAPPAVTVTTEAKPAEPASTPERQPVANEPPPAAKLGASSDAAKTVEVQAKKETIDNRSVAQQEREKNAELAKGESRRAEETGAAPASRPAKAKDDSFSSLSSARARPKLKRDGVDKDENEADTRSVAGRHFRKQRGIWIDTAYETPMNLTTLTRGSEQFRALVADEPAIKSIADQLDGEIIVVWKGLAYRIR